MMNLQTLPNTKPLLLQLPGDLALQVSPEQFAVLAAANRDLRFERTATEESIVNPPTGGRVKEKHTVISELGFGVMAIATLIEQLKTVPDWRRNRPVQCPLWLMLLMSLLGVMSGYSSLRGLADFMERHQSSIAELLELEQAKLPKYSTIRRMTHKVEGGYLSEIFQH